MIEVGEYVRTKKGQIDKIYEYKEDVETYICEKDLIIDIKNMIGTYAKDIVKHSKNIIDLIEEGDYVNGLEVYKGKVASGEEKLLVGNHIINGMALEIVNIKSILTKEQFSSVEYRLE